MDVHPPKYGTIGFDPWPSWLGRQFSASVRAAAVKVAAYPAWAENFLHQILKQSLKFFGRRAEAPLLWSEQRTWTVVHRCVKHHETSMSWVSCELFGVFGVRGVTGVFGVLARETMNTVSEQEKKRQSLGNSGLMKFPDWAKQQKYWLPIQKGSWIPFYSCLLLLWATNRCNWRPKQQMYPNTKFLCLLKQSNCLWSICVRSICNMHRSLLANYVHVELQTSMLVAYNDMCVCIYIYI